MIIGHNSEQPGSTWKENIYIDIWSPPVKEAKVRHCDTMPPGNFPESDFH